MVSAPDPLRSQRARVAALTRWSREDPKPALERTRAAFDRRFEREVDPDGVLSPEERTRRAAAARKAYFARLALKSAKARRRRRSSVSADDQVVNGDGVSPRDFTSPADEGRSA
jgi:hypothetical protein